MAMLTPILLMVLSLALGGQPRRPASNLPDAQFVSDLHDKKIDEALMLFTADAVFVEADGTEIHNGPALRALFEHVAMEFDSSLVLQPAMVEQMSRSIKESGDYKEGLRHRDTGKLDILHGKYVFVGRMDAGGQWRYTRMEWH